MASYRREVDKVAGFFSGYQVEHIDRRKNEAADAFSRIGSRREPVPPNVFKADLYHPSVKLPTEEELAVPDDPESQLVAGLHQSRHGQSRIWLIYSEKSYHKKKYWQDRLYVGLSLMSSSMVSYTRGARRSFPTMCFARGRPENPTGDPLRGLRTSRINKIKCSQSIQTWILLVDSFGRRGKYSPVLRWMSVLCKTYSRVGLRFKDHPNNMVFRSMGHGHGRTLPAITRQENTSLSGSGPIHKVG